MNQGPVEQGPDQDADDESGGDMDGDFPFDVHEFTSRIKIPAPVESG
jgi:hypothetical protein